MSSVNEAVRFVLEIVAFFGLGYWGWHVDGPLPVRILTMVLAPVAAATVWAIWVAPNSSARLDDPMRLVVELVVFGGATAAWFLAGRREVAVIFGLVTLVNLVLMTVLSQR